MPKNREHDTFERIIDIDDDSPWKDEGVYPEEDPGLGTVSPLGTCGRGGGG